MFYDEIKEPSQNNIDAELISGRLRETYQNFNNNRDAYYLEVGDRPINADKLTYFVSYAQEYFNGDFIKGQGAEELLNAVLKHQPAGDYLDLGSGPTGLFWCLPLSNAQSITFSDVILEALLVLQGFRAEKNYPNCYQQVMDLLGLPRKHLLQVFDLPAHFAVFDCFSPWPDFITQKIHTRVSAYGVLSICKDEQLYRQAVDRVSEHLSEGGIFIGADWIRHPQYKIAEDGNDTSYLKEDMVRSSLLDANFDLEELQTLTIEGDRLYSHIVHWVAKKTARNPA